MACLIVISAYFFQLQTTLHSWLGIIIVLATTYCYMNIAVRLVDSSPPPTKGLAEKAHLLEEGETLSGGEGGECPSK
jgi:solute carrier family 35 (UDP-sugar transporter), member A1/2/3